MEGFCGLPVEGTLGGKAIAVELKGFSVLGFSFVGTGPPAGIILMSAQFTNVSCFFPQLFPTVHHHCSTQ